MASIIGGSDIIKNSEKVECLWSTLFFDTDVGSMASSLVDTGEATMIMQVGGARGTY